MSRVNKTVVTTMLFIVNFVFVLFLISEISKLCGNFLKVPKGYIYSSYAREGFFQLLFVTLINFGIILYLIYKTNLVKEDKKVVDLGADFRLKDEATFKEWYNVSFIDKKLHEEAVYGLCEHYKDEIKNAKVIANPGCYVTSISLPLMPLLKEKLIKKEGIVADSKSGVTGAGRGLTLLSHYPEINENMVPYKIGNHRHTPEIEQNLTDAAGEPVEIIFTPILAPMNRGILSTIYCDKAEDVTIEKIQNELEEFYKDKPFVDVLPLGQVATVKHVRLSNKCAISVHENKSKIIICSTIDNMVKGSAGQAIQNMNLMLGFDECEGLSTMATAF